MAAFTLSPSTPPVSNTQHHAFQSTQLCCSKNRVFSPTKEHMSARSEPAGWERGLKVTCQAASIPADRAPAMERRKLMNLLLFGAVGLPAAGMLVPYSDMFPPSPGYCVLRGCVVARDEDGNSIIASEWLKVHGTGDKTLTQGLKGGSTYLIVENNRSLATYGINAVCTHLGCIVPWNTVKKKFVCPCHGSQYNNVGTVIEGPAHLPLELANVDIEDDKVVFAPWTGTDFRTGDAPWWS